jgi:hypothetical protein
MNDLRILRDRNEFADAVADSASAGDDTACADALLGQIVDRGSFPTDPAAFFAVVPVDIDGDENEGSEATYVPRTDSVIYAINVGNTFPSAGDTVLCHAVGGRWVFRFGN